MNASLSPSTAPRSGKFDNQECCEFLPWDTSFFGCRIARIVAPHLTPLLADSVQAWCETHGIDCLYFLASSDDAETVETAESRGFGLKDVRLTYHRRFWTDHGAIPPSSPVDGEVRVRESRPEDREPLEAIAKSSFTDSRYFHDRRFPRTVVERFYAHWLRSSLEGAADRVIVLEQAGRARGFITCKLKPARLGQIPLVCLDAPLRGRGLGRRLYLAALEWFSTQEVDGVEYVTQARNIGAQRLIQQFGFTLSSVQLWYHKWFSKEG